MYKGYIVTEPDKKINGIVYRGVDNYAFPLEFCDCELFSKSEIEELEYSLNFVDTPFLLNSEQMKKYVQECKNKQIPYRILYCEVFNEKEILEFQPSNKDTNKLFLGYDYAFGSGDYYSSVATDIIYRQDLLSCMNLLNSNGLIDDINDVQIFIKLRNDTIQKAGEDSMLFEKGDFAIYCVWLIEDI